MKNYGKFITFIIFFTAGILSINSLIICPIIIYGFTLPCPLFSFGTIALIISLVFLIWDLLLWKVKMFPFSLIGYLFGFYNSPDLDGEWLISYESSYKYDEKNNKYVTKGEGRATIKQTYSNLFVYGDFGVSSKFESFVSKIKEKENGKWFMIYAYRNTPINLRLKSSSNGGSHEGFCYLEISKNCEEMKGYYSNDEQRKTRGSISFKKLRNRGGEN